MPARGKRRREGQQQKRVLSIFLSALILLPNNSTIASAAVQVFGATESAGVTVAKVAAGAGSIGAIGILPVPLATTIPLAYSSSLTAPSPAARALTISPSNLEPMFAAPAAPNVLQAPPDKATIAAGPTQLPFGDSQSTSRRDNTEKLGTLFDGESAPKRDSILFFLVHHGQAPIATELRSLEATLKTFPVAAQALNKNGMVRLVLGNRSSEEIIASPEFKAKYPEALGVTETSPLKQAWTNIAGNPLLNLGVLPFRLILRALKRNSKTETAVSRSTVAKRIPLPKKVLSEARFLIRAFLDSLTKPLPSEIVGGIVTKGPPFVTSLVVYWTTIGLRHPLALAGLTALSLTQETFHGIFLNSWNNFQENINRLRGFSYQMYFNLLYMQGFGAMYRAVSWSANPEKITPPWSQLYWGDMLAMSVVGTFFGTLGYNGLNTLHAKGLLKRWQRSAIQQLRDAMFLIGGPFFTTGFMHAFWAIFIFQQSLDFTIALISWLTRTRTILYAIAPAGSAENTERLVSLLRDHGVTASVSSDQLTIETAAREALK